MSLRDFFSGLGDALSNAFSGNEDREPTSRGPSRKHAPAAASFDYDGWQ
jgi:hypothetical protein